VPDFIVTNFAVLGGINRTIRFIGACEAMGVGFWCYSGDTGVCTAAYLHVSAAMPWISEPSQSLFRWQVGDVIEGGPFRQRDNVVPVPEGPGLGVALDRDALACWHRHFVEHGPMDHFHDPARPGRYRRLPLA
jgi:glucarate dehydratase